MSTFSFIGLGLGSPEDITIRGLNTIKSADHVYAEIYTAILPESSMSDSSVTDSGDSDVSKTMSDSEANNLSNDESMIVPGLSLSKTFKNMEKVWGLKPGTIKVADRDLVEKDDNELINLASQKLQNQNQNQMGGNNGTKIAFLVVGDPLCATTHTDLYLRLKESNTFSTIEVIHNASIMNGVARCGLQLYRFGETISVPFWHRFGDVGKGSTRPESFYYKLIENYKRGLHTLCLLDIMVKERNEKSLQNNMNATIDVTSKDESEFEPPRFMSIRDCLGQLLVLERGNIERIKKERKLQFKDEDEEGDVDDTPSTKISNCSESNNEENDHDVVPWIPPQTNDPQDITNTVLDYIKDCESDTKSKTTNASSTLKSLSDDPTLQFFSIIHSHPNLIGIARLGCKKTEVVKSGTFKQLMDYDFGGPLHALVVPSGELDCVEEEFLEKVTKI